MMKKLLCLGLLLLTTCSIAAPQQQPLPIDQAFGLSAQLFGEDTVILQWKIAPKHYLYRDRLHFTVLQPKQVEIGRVLFPVGIPKEDEIFGKYVVYAQDVTIPVPIIHAASESISLEVKYQGCAEDGYCYPPTTAQFKIGFKKGYIERVNTITHPTSLNVDTSINQQQQPFISLLTDHHIVGLLLAFLGFGILLSLTPCVLPMIPILLGIIIGQQKTVLRGKTFSLSVVYVMSMAITYAIAGMLAGWLGASIQVVFQKPWVIIGFSLLFVLLALSFFGLYTLKIPTYFEERIANLSRHQKSGHYLGVAIMGCLATLIVSPCVTPALVGVLSYIGKTGDIALGGLALFMMGLGMGVPLLILGLAGGKLLPKTGAWMQTLEYLFGVLFLAIAIWMVSHLIPPPIVLILGSSLLMICAVYLGALSPTPIKGWGKFFKGVGVVLLSYGFLMAIGAAQGNGNLWQPLASAATTASPTTPQFIPVKSLAQVQTALHQAQVEHKPVLLDFYADWCSSCKEMESSVFANPAVRAKLNHFIVLKADITHATDMDKQLMQHFQVLAPPTFLIWNQQGEWLQNLTRTGKLDTTEFLEYLKQVS